MSIDIGAAPQPRNVVSFSDALARRRASMPPLPATPAPFEHEPDAEPTLDICGRPVFANGLCFSLEDLLWDEGSNAVEFPNQRVEAHIRGVFDRWGFELAEFTSSFEDMLAAYKVFSLDFDSQFWPGRVRPDCESAALRLYLDAVEKGDVTKARKRMAKAGMREHMAKAREHEQAKAIEEMKPQASRSSALQNPVIKLLLATPIRGALDGSTLEALVREVFESGLVLEHRLRESLAGRPMAPEPKKPAGDRSDYHALRMSKAFTQLLGLGMVPLMNCPRAEHAGVLFEAEKFALALDNSSHRASWRGELGPFVGFDQTFGLLMEADLAWWRLENKHSQGDVGLPVAVEQGPTQLVLPKTRIGPRKAPGLAAREGATLRVVPASGNKGKAVRVRARNSEKAATLEVVLSFNGAELLSTTPYLLGAGAYLCGISSVATQYEIRPFESLVLRARKGGYHSDLMRAVDDKAAREALRLFHCGLHDATVPHGAGHGPAFADWFNEHRLPLVLDLVPTDLRKFDRIGGS